MQNKRRPHSRVAKYHYATIKMCIETDVLMTKCRVCWNLYPSTTEYFVIDWHQWAERRIQPFCRKCSQDYQKQLLIQKKAEQNKPKPADVHAESLFEEEESVESKVDRILAFLWLNRWACKKS
jgi:hypothetical protein